MKFFTAIKQSEFAAALLSAAGFNLEQLAAAGNTNALKAHLDSLKPSADHAALSAKVTTLTEENTTLNAALASAKTENDEAKADLLKAVTAGSAATAQAALFTTSLAAAGVKIPAATADKPLDAAAIQGALDARISTKAREQLAAHGHNDPLPVEASSDPAKGGKPAAANLTGLARTKAALKARNAAAAGNN